MYYAVIIGYSVIEVVNSDDNLDDIKQKYPPDVTIEPCDKTITTKHQYIDGTFVNKEEEINVLLLDKIRLERNKLLSLSDWTQLQDNNLSETKRQEWVTYRQELRDFPATCDINNPIFPTPPT